MFEHQEFLFLLIEDSQTVQACFEDGFAEDPVNVTLEDSVLNVTAEDGSLLTATPLEKGPAETAFREQVNEIWNQFRLTETRHTAVLTNLLHQIRLYRSLYTIQMTAPSADGLSLLRRGLLDSCCNGGGLRLSTDKSTFRDEDDNLVLCTVGGESALEYYNVKELPQVNEGVSPAALSRRAHTLTLLEPLHLYIPGWLPIPTCAPEEIPDQTAIIQRMLALAMSALYADGVMQKKWTAKQSRQYLKPYLDAMEAEPFFTPQELTFLSMDLPKRDALVEYSWNYEQAWTLYWALGLTDTLDFPSREGDTATMAEHLQACASFPELAERCTLRPRKTLLAEADLYFCYNWSVLDVCGQMGLPSPAALNPGVVAARHKALNWLAAGGDWIQAGTRM